MLQGIEEDRAVIYNCSSCENEILSGERLCRIELRFHTKFYCMDCVSIEVAEEE